MKKFFLLPSPKKILVCSIGIYTLVFTMLVFWKYSHFYYDNLDLAIFNNVFWNTLHGDWFRASIHPPSYLGDHFSPGIFLLLPFYMLWPRPELLLLLQTIILALSAWPLYLIAQHIFDKKRKWLPLFVSSLWLLNPIVHNMNFFEFELMAPAVFGLLWTIWAYLTGRKIPFIIFSLFTLSMREDFVFILVFFAVIAFFEKKSLFWKLFPIVTSLLWGYAAFSIISVFASNGSYKFLRYYGWLGGTDLASIALSFITHPVQVLLHLTTWYNLEFVLGLLFPFFFFVLFRSYVALLLIAPTAQIMLAGFGGSALILDTYYAGYIVAILFVLFAYKLKSFDPSKLPKILPSELRTSPAPWYFIILLATIYGALTYGSIAAAVSWRHTPHAVTKKQNFVRSIPDMIPIATTYELLSPLSSRPSVYVFPYAAIGKNQFGLKDYRLPEDTRYLLIDWEDMVLAHMHFVSNNVFKQYADTVPENLMAIFSHFTVQKADGSLMLFERGNDKSVDTLVQRAKNPSPEHTEAYLAGVKPHDSYLTVSVALPEAPDPAKHYYLEIQTNEGRFNVPLAYGLYEPRTMAGEKITMPIFVSPAEKEVKLSLRSWGTASIELTGIKSLETSSDETSIDTMIYRSTR